MRRTVLSRRALVYAYLASRVNQWVPGYEIADPTVGGSEGLRRLRELRTRGHKIEMRPKSGSDANEYRLVVP